jgi:hypothetical protein
LANLDDPESASVQRAEKIGRRMLGVGASMMAIGCGLTMLLIVVVAVVLAL